MSRSMSYDNKQVGDKNNNTLITNGRAAPGRPSSTYGENNLSMSGRPAGRPWSRFWDAYISATMGPID